MSDYPSFRSASFEQPDWVMRHREADAEDGRIGRVSKDAAARMQASYAGARVIVHTHNEQFAGAYLRTYGDMQHVLAFKTDKGERSLGCTEIRKIVVLGQGPGGAPVDVDFRR